MAKQLNVNLNVSANTQQAQQSLQQLQMTLNTIANTPIKLNGATISKEMAIAKQSAQDLQRHLNNAFNTKTGNLDLSKLNASLKASGQNIGTLSANLLKAGNVGQTAFLNLQRSISQASVQINQANGLLTQFWTTLKNTARWQLSSSLLHGFMGSLQSAWGYAKDLDKSLNNIRIVTGYSAEKMSDFADQANKAAKALSATTTDYTNASLIYFQQGLSDAEVIERTNVTVKMANVVGQSVETISDQLTAIWNNFDDGTKSLEYYADVITALGAATASSSEEIATGLEKFASIATTVGLSYEYATAALATVTAETRQSADVVGTAFKTLFARLQDLEVGKTLDDGTTLGKYSAALASVGVNIKDASGELKDMDTILDELGSKWSTLSKDMQVAVAQTVAGTRQYSQLLALMSNWDVFQTNLKTIDTSEDTLTNQAAIYEDSWSATTKRVKAATEGIYNNLIPTDQLTDLADGFATFLEGIESVIEGMGGLKSILLLVSSIALSAFQNQIGGAIDNLLVKITSLGSNFKLSLGGSLSSIKSITSELSAITANSNFQTLSDQFERIGINANQASQYTHQMAVQGRNANAYMAEYNTNLMQINNTQALIEQSNKYLTAGQKEQLALLQQQAQIANEQLLTARQSQASAQLNLQNQLSTEGDELWQDRYGTSEADGRTQFTSSANAHEKQNLVDTLRILREQDAVYKGIGTTLSENRRQIVLQFDDSKDLAQVNQQAKKDYADIYATNYKIQQIKNKGLSPEEEQKQIQGVINELKTKNQVAGQYVENTIKEKKLGNDIAKGVAIATSNMRTLVRATGSSSQQTQNLESGIQNAGRATDILNAKTEAYKNAIAQVTSTLQNGLVKAMSVGNVAAGMLSGFSKAAMGINAVNNAINTLKNDDADWITKLTSGAMAATMGFQGLMAVLGGVSNFIGSINTAVGLNTTLTTANTIAQKAGTEATLDNRAAEMAKLLIKRLGLQQSKDEVKQQILETVAEKGDTAETWNSVAADYAKVASQAAKLWWITLIIAALAALVAITVAAIEADKKEEAQLKKSTAAAKEAAEEYDNISQKVSGIKSAFDEYDTVVEKLNSCTKGTQEWRDALDEVNTQVNKIMTDYPELVTKYKDAFYRDAATGTMMIREEAKEQIIQDYDNATLKASFHKSATAAQVQRDQAAYNLKDDIQSSGLAYSTQNLLRERARKGERLTGLSEDNDFITQAAYALIAQNSSDNYVMPLELAMSQVTNALEDLETPLQEYTESIDNASESLLIAAQAITDKAIPDAAAEVKNIVAADLTQQEKLYKDAYLGLMTDIGNDSGEYATALGISQSEYDLGISKTSGLDNFAYNKILADLQNYVDSGFSAWTDNAIQGDDSNRYLTFADSEGNEWKKSADYIASKLASAKVLAEISGSVDKAQELLSTIDSNVKGIEGVNNSDEQVTAINTFIGYKSFDTVKANDFNALYNQVAGKDGEVEANETEDYLKKVFGVGELTEKEAGYFGYSTVDALINGFTNGLKSGRLVVEGSNAFKEALGNIANSLTLNDLGNLTTIFNKINLGPAGEKAGQSFMAGINKMIDGLSDSEKIEALQALSAIDWTAYDAIDQAAIIMTKYGKSIDTVAGEWKDFADEMRIAVHAIPDFSALRDNLTAVNKILKDLDFGSIIEDEDYQTLIKYNSAWEKFFIMQADGTRKFIGNSNDMQRVTRDIAIAGRKEMGELGALVNTITTNGEKYTVNDDELKKRYERDPRAYLNAYGAMDDEWTQTRIDSGESLLTIAGDYAKANYAKNEIFNQEGVKALLSAKGYTEEDLADIIQETKEGNTARLNDIFNMLNDTMGQDYKALTSNYEEMVASTAVSVMDLDSLLKAGEISENTYKKALLGLASGYEECRDELEEYNEVMDDANSTEEEKIVAQKKLKKALTDSSWKKLTKDIKKYNEELKDLTDTEEIAKKQKEMADAINSAFGTNISSTFVAENKGLIDEWMNSTGDKATELGLKLQSLAVMQSTAATSIIDATVDGVSRTSDAIEARWINMKSTIEANPITIDANGRADLTQLLNALMTAGYTAQEVANYLASIGQTDITIAGWANGGNIDLSNPEDLATFLKNFKGGVNVTSASVPSRGIADMSNYKGSGGGGGGNKKKTKKSDVVERYKEINDELDETARKMNKASSIADTLWGDARFDKIQEGIDLLKEENAELERKAQLQQQYLAEDRTALNAAAAAAGVSFTYGADGNITNYTSEMERLYAQLKAAEDSGNNSEVERLTKLIEDLENARKQYEETLQEGYDIDEKRLENQIKIWAENFKKITEKLELEIKINDKDLAILEYYLKKVEGNAFQAAESFALLVDQQKEHTENLAAYRQAYEDAKKAYEAGEISEAEYKEAIEQAQQGILDELSALQELQEQMEDYYGNTIAMAQEEMAAFIEQMEHSTSVLDHYSSILDIIGKQQDYATKGTVLKGRADSLRNELETQRKLYEDYSKDADEYYAKMMAAEVGSDEYLYYKKQWEAAQQAANEAQENMLAKTEEWAEAMKTVVENELEGLAKTLEEAMTGGTNFDTMLTSMERASTLQEEYLTTTNKIYETNKLMRTAQQEIDKTTNSVAKRRLSQFIKETEQLQSQNKLSKYELEIQQAKYDLLLAEIALEEAQNAKSTVRLQRDSEGNFGYVYTADSSAIAEAESQLADAQNSLYNIGLEGANDYGQKYAETMSEMYDTLKELQTQYLEGAFDNEEEYNNAVAEAKKYYYEKLEQYSSLYSVALTTDSRVVADAWSTDFNEMIYKTDEWKAKVDEYTAKAAETLGEWQKIVSQILAETGLDDTAAAVKDVTDKSKELATFLNGEGGLIEVLTKEREAVKETIDKNKEWYESIKLVIEEYEKLMEQLNKDYKAPSQGNNNGEESGSGGENSGGGSGSGNEGEGSGNPGGNNPGPNNPEVQYCQSCGKPLSQCDCNDIIGFRVGTDGEKVALANRNIDDAITEYISEREWLWDDDSKPIFKITKNGEEFIYDLVYTYLNGAKKSVLQNGGSANGTSRNGGGPGGRLQYKALSAFDTGGYTGSWGSYGKMAMLHEKELVLNAHDTENFLASMELLNRIIEVINLHSASAQLYGLSMTPGRMTGFDNGTLEQHVTIEANFPSVQDRNEIEEAFTNLINQASQYANRI